MTSKPLSAEKDHDGPCYYCGERTVSLAGDPSLWPMKMSHADDPGVNKYHHSGCLSDRVHRTEVAEAEVAALKSDIEALRKALGGAKENKDGAYLERNRLVALLARIFPSGLKVTDIDGWDPAWHRCVYIDTPTGQLSWHYHESHAWLFYGLPAYAGEWDGHTTEKKYERIERLYQPIDVRTGDARLGQHRPIDKIARAALTKG